MWYSPLEAVAGLLLLFVLPGFFTTRALFPEWRLSGPEALTRGVETAALSWVVSTAYTVLVGTVLLNLPGAGFSSGWSDPVLEAALAAISGAAAVAAVARGGFSRTVPPARAPEPSGGEGGGWERMQELEELGRQERRLRHALRTATDPADSERLKAELERLDRQRDGLRRAREAEYSV